MPLCPAVIGRPDQIGRPRQPGGTGQFAIKSRDKLLGQSGGGTHLNNPRLTLIRTVPKGLRQPVHGLCRDQNGRGRDVGVQRHANLLPRQHRHQSAPRHGRIGGNLADKFRQPLGAIKHQHKCLVLDRKQRRFDRFAHRFSVKQDQQFAIGKALVKPQPCGIIT